AVADPARIARLENPTAIPTPPFRKLRRSGIHSTGSIGLSSARDAFCSSNNTAAKANWRVDLTRPHRHMVERLAECAAGFPHVAHWSSSSQNSPRSPSVIVGGIWRAVGPLGDWN